MLPNLMYKLLLNHPKSEFEPLAWQNLSNQPVNRPLLDSWMSSYKQACIKLVEILEMENFPNY